MRIVLARHGETPWNAEGRYQGQEDIALSPVGIAQATALGERLRDLLLNEAMHLETETLLMFAARREHLAQVIEPALARGAWVVGDRHDLSSQAYQGGGRGIDAKLMSSLRDTVLGDFRPDLTLYLDLPPAIGLQRARARGELDRIEQEALPFFERTRARYLELAAEDSRIKTIDASQTIEQVTASIEQTLKNWFDEQQVAAQGHAL